MKTEVFRERSTATAKLKAELSEVTSNTDENTLSNIFRNTKTRLGFLIRQEKIHFEHLLIR